MNLLSLYHKLPYPLRIAAASARGLTLRRWRYGPETERLIEVAQERENWPEEEWHAYQEQQLAVLLDRAARQVPYYRQHWAERRQAGDGASWAYLENWPLLNKDALRAHPHAFLADDCDPRRMVEEHTSGTTGKPLTLWVGRQAAREWYALFEARVRLWNGVNRFDHWAIFGGQLVTPVEQTRPPFWVWNAALNQLYLSSYHLSAQTAPAYLDALSQHRVTYLLGYPSAMASLAQLALAAGLESPPVRVAISNAEPLFPHQRDAITAAFGGRVVDTYGMAEQVAAASECRYGRMHLWPDAGIIEVLADDCDEPLGAGETGRLVCTGLINRDMPLIRYAVGDRGALDAGGEPCPCGRRLPQMGAVEGRMDDMVLTADGRRIGRLDPVFKSDLPILEAQIIQEQLDFIRLLVVPAAGFDQEHARQLEERLKDRVGEMTVQVDRVDAIPRLPNGKFKAVVSHVQSENRRDAENTAGRKEFP